MKETIYAIKSRNRGISLIIVSLLLMVIVPLVGLAIDLTTLYLVRTKPQTPPSWPALVP